LPFLDGETRLIDHQFNAGYEYEQWTFEYKKYSWLQSIVGTQHEIENFKTFLQVVLCLLILAIFAFQF